MAEKKSVGHAYNVDFLNVVFAATSIFLFVCVIWMVWDDYDRDWKNTQRRFNQLEIQVTQQQLQAAGRNVNATKLHQLEQQRAAVEKNVDANRQKVDQLQAKIDDINARLDRETQDYQFAKAKYDVNRYAFEVRRDAKKAGADEQKDIDEQAARVNALNATVEKTTSERGQVQAELGKYTGQLVVIKKQIAEMQAEQTRLQGRLETIEPSFAKTLRDAPMTDFLAPTIKVQQTVLPNIVDDVNFTKVPKMDRCTTCHLAIDKKGYEKYPQPFRTHPNLTAYIGSDSPHPLNKIGCTVCHDGMGQSVDFTHAAHTPRNEKQAKEWEEKYHWERLHDWDYPMQPIGMTEASCAKCHREQVYVPNASTLALAYSTFERAGCYACHKTRGFEGLRKPGPSLKRIKAKLTPQWVADWIRDPRAAKPTTWMPQIWYDSNSNSPEDAVRNEAEIKSVVAYLFANSEEYTPAAAPPPGDYIAGRKLVETVGCLGCHVTPNERDRSAAGPRRTFGQPLQGIGAKATYPWIYDWVKNPSHYSPSTYMPNLRLTDQEAADVAAYLLTLGGKAFGPPVDQRNQAASDAALLDYFKAAMPGAEAEAKLKSMDASAKELELGQRVIGRYGCFSCHEIKGFEKTQAIGVDLSEEASKLVTRLDFAFAEIPHSKMAWFEQKLHDPRSFDKGRVLQPLDKLRMPDFHFSDQENQLLRTAILSFQRYVQPPAALPTQNARMDFLKTGRGVVHRRNCVGCHTIEGDGGDFLKLVDDPSLGPPLLTPEGARVQADWLYAFLRGPIPIRPWLNVRMPTFGLDDDHLNEVIEYFQAIPNQIRPFRTIDAVRVSNDTAGGKELFELLKCQKCHVLGEVPKDQPTANLAPDLRMAAERLQPEWIEEWLKAPLKIVPGTRMPMFWPNYPKSDFPQMGADGERQIQAIRDHVMSFRGGPSPKKAAGAAMSAN